MKQLVLTILIFVFNAYVAHAQVGAEVSCKDIPTERLMVALVFGQSNAANYGSTPMSVKSNVFSYYRGQCFRASDPLPGSSGKGGSVWSRLGPLLVQSGKFDNVLFVPIAVGSTTVAQWMPKGMMHLRLTNTMLSMRKSELKFTHLLWHQGEHDAMADTSSAQYRENFLSMLASIREYGVDAPVYVSVATRCWDSSSDKVRAAQQALPSKEAAIMPGPDTDTLGPRFRFDGCHFSALGLQKAAELWLAKLALIN
jgi:hypothetical protein